MSFAELGLFMRHAFLLPFQGLQKAYYARIFVLALTFSLFLRSS